MEMCSVEAGAPVLVVGAVVGVVVGVLGRPRSRAKMLTAAPHRRRTVVVRRTGVQ